MDPKTCFATMGDFDLTLSERSQAALDMLMWLLRSGDCPISGGISRIAARLRAERTLCELLDEYEAIV